MSTDEMNSAAAPAPAPVPAPAPIGAPAPVMPDPYLSNPFVLLWESVTRLGINIGPLFGLIGIALLAALTLIPGVLLLWLGHSNAVGLVLGILLTVAAVGALVYVGLRVAAANYLLAIANARRQAHSTRQFYDEAKPLIVPVLGVSVLTGLIVGVGFLLLIVPGLLFTYWFALAPYILVDQKCGVIESLKRSKALVQGHAWEIFGLYGTIEFAGLLENVPLIGFVISILIGLCTNTAYAIRYVQLKDLTDSGQPKAAVNAWNYVMAVAFPVIVVGLVVIFIAVAAHTWSTGSTTSSTTYSY